jgi:hypothetical protein
MLELEKLELFLDTSSAFGKPTSSAKQLHFSQVGSTKFFSSLLKPVEVFQWGPTQQKAFEELKQYLIELTTLTPPSPGAPLLLYVSASHAAVSAALVQEKQDGQAKKQVPVYFISEVLSLSKEITQSWRRYYMLY